MPESWADHTSQSLMMERIRDRQEAGVLLARKLTFYANRPDVVALALPRGGVAVGYEIANRLNAPLDVFLVQKLAVPGYEELTVGAVAMGNVEIIDPQIVEEFCISRATVEKILGDKRKELASTERIYRAGLPALDVRGKNVILVDDGIVTGGPIRAAVEALRQLAPVRIVVAVAVAPLATVLMLAHDADEIVCHLKPRYFRSVGALYQNFPQLTDEEACRFLKKRVAELQESDYGCKHSPC